MADTYLVTGANRGLGLEFARQLAARGEEVIATARRPEHCPELSGLGVRVEVLDVTDRTSIRWLSGRLADTPLDVLILNAGMGGTGQSLGQLHEEELLRFFRINSLGPLFVLQAMLPALLKGSRKLVVGITSRMGSLADNGSGGYYGYRASKAALNMFFRSAAVDLLWKDISLLLLHPGWVRTDMGGEKAPLSPEESVRSMLKVIDTAGLDTSGRFLDYSGAEVPW